MTMQTSKERLWKQIGTHVQEKPPRPPKKPKQGQKRVRFAKIENQQICVNKNNKKYTEISFQVLQLSQIKQQDFEEVLNSFVNPTKCQKFDDNLENILLTMSQSKNAEYFTSQNIDQMADNKKKGMENKFIQTCQIFMKILAHLKEQIKYLEKSTIREIQKTKELQNYEQKELQKLVSLIQNKMKMIQMEKQEKQKQLQIWVQKIQQGRERQKQLNSIISEYMNRFQEISQTNQQKQKEFLMKIQSLYEEKTELQNKNNELEEKIFELEQRISGFQLQIKEKAEEMVKKSLHSGDDQLIRSSENLLNTKYFSIKTSKTLLQSQCHSQKEDEGAHQPQDKQKKTQLEKEISLRNSSNKNYYFQTLQQNRRKKVYSSHYKKDLLKPQKLNLQHEWQTCPNEKDQKQQKGYGSSGVDSPILSKVRKSLFKTSRFDPSYSFEQQNLYQSTSRLKSKYSLKVVNSMLLERKNLQNVELLGSRIKKIQTQIKSEIKNIKDSMVRNIF